MNLGLVGSEALRGKYQGFTIHQMYYLRWYNDLVSIPLCCYALRNSDIIITKGLMLGLVMQRGIYNAQFQAMGVFPSQL